MSVVVVVSAGECFNTNCRDTFTLGRLVTFVLTLPFIQQTLQQTLQQT